MSKLSASDFIIQKLMECDEKITILLTGPCSNLVAALEKNEKLKEKIEEVVWMGGAIFVPGNVY